MSRKERIDIRVTPEEKEMIFNEAKKKKTTVTALILNSIERHITVKLDTSDYRDLVIQVRRIGNNINTLLKRVHFNQFITNDDIEEIKTNQEALTIELRNHKRMISTTKDKIANLTHKQMKKYLEEEEKKIPLFLIYDEISFQITRQLRTFIDLLEKEEFLDIYPPYIESFIKNFEPTLYSYDELVLLSDDLSKIIYAIDKKTILGKESIKEDEFDQVMQVLNKHRKR